MRRILLQLFLALLATTAHSATCGMFKDTRVLTRDDISNLVIADFDGDRIRDVLYSAGSTVFITPGNRSSNFGYPALTAFKLGRAVNAVAAADFNGDGLADLALASGNEVQILVSTGSFRFAPASIIRLQTTRLVALDYDGDGHQDLYASSSKGILLIRGLGNGHFAAPRLAYAGNFSFVEWGDFNGDGLSDAFTARTDSYQGDVTARILMNRGKGSLIAENASQHFPSFYDPWVGDVDGDGLADLLFAAGDNQEKLGIALHSPAGGFRTPRYFSGRWPVISPRAIDLNLDGKQDLFYALDYDQFAYRLSNGGGSFGPLHLGQIFVAAFNTTPGDVNGDGIPDVVAWGSGVAVLAGNGRGFESTHSLGSNLENVNSVAAADFNDDGRIDIAAASENIAVYLNQGNFNFRRPTYTGLGRHAGSLLSLDLNRDSHADLVDVGNGDLRVLLGKGDGSFFPPRSYALGRNLTRPVSGDFNGDGIPDVAVASGDIAPFWLLMGNGDGSFNIRTIDVPAFDLAAGDLDGDGRSDLVVNDRNKVTILLSNGDGTFHSGQSFAMNSPFEMNIGDLDLDGIPDVIVGLYGAILEVLGGAGRGEFQAPIKAYTEALPDAIADLDGDGHLDIVSGKLILLNRTNPADHVMKFDAVFYANGGAYAAVADFNGDSLLDLAGIGDPPHVVLLINTCK